MTDASVAVGNGYGEGKYVSERVSTYHLSANIPRMQSDQYFRS